jgi:hypothetical protein
VITLDTFLQNVESDFKFRQRRHQQWTDNYELYRDTVITNRLTQRQSVNVPLMKETITTRLAGLNDAPDLYFENLDGDKQKELFKNEYWTWTAEQNKLEVRDMVDKKQEELYGRSFMKLNIVNGRILIEVLDPFDVLVDRYIDPADLDSARRITHLHIFKPLSVLERNKFYSADALRRLRTFYATKQGLIRAEQNVQAMTDKNKRMSDMGVPDINNPVLGETYVELNEQLYMDWDSSRKEEVVRVAVRAENQIIMDRPLRDILNVNFFPYVTMASDVERTDFWSDGTGDIVRVPNQILNVFFSQLVENRTLRNYGMNYYNSTVEGFMPQTFQPSPWGWYPIPGNPNDLVKRVEIPDLSESLDEMNFIIQMNERATAATGIEKGTGPDKQITLGEVQLLAAKAAKRIKADDKYIMRRNKDLGDKFWKLADANADKLEPVKLYKKSVKGNYWAREVKPSDWKSKSGYNVRVISKSEKDEEALDQIQKMAAMRQYFPGNPAFDKTMKEIALDIANLDPAKKKEIMDADQQAQATLQGQQASLPAPQGTTLQQLLGQPQQQSITPNA